MEGGADSEYRIMVHVLGVSNLLFGRQPLEYDVVVLILYVAYPIYILYKVTQIVVAGFYIIT